MNLRDFNYLVALAENKSFKIAAKICNCTQPTLSMQIKKLEEYLQIQIFERNVKNVTLTPLGEEIYKIAKEIGRLEKEIKDLAKTSRNPLQGEIKIGAFPTLAPFYFPKIVPLINKQFPDLQLFLVEEKSNKLIEMLENGELDIAFLAMPVKNNNFVSHEIFEDEFFLAVPKNHHLAKSNSVKLSDLSEEKLFILNEGHCLRDQTLEFCKLAKINENNTFKATSIETLRNMVLGGMGITIIPKVAANEVDGIKYLKINSKQKTSRKIGVYWRKHSYRVSPYEKIHEKLWK